MLQGSSIFLDLELMIHTCIVLQYQENGAYPMGFDETLDAVNLYVVL